MITEKKYYKRLDIIRVISCIGVLLYHLNILKGGFLAVCVFFVLSGYLSCISSFRKEKFSIFKYYLNRIKNIYLPLVIVTFITILAISYIKEINWLNLKPESTSVLLGYNNFWQISVNADYFAHHVGSPFMHFWYIAILLQFELVFPFIFIIFKKLGDKIHKCIPIILLIIMSLISMYYFYYMCNTNTSIINIYYNTLTRLFSIIFGLTIGFIYSYNKPFTILKNKYINTIIFYLYLTILCVMFFIVDSNSQYFSWYMIIATVISCRLIRYSTLIESNLNIIDKLINKLSKITYEIYLIQYPIIFISQYIMIKSNYKLPIIILSTIILSIILHISLNIKKEKLYKLIPRIIVLSCILTLSGFGAYKYINEKDHTKEMDELKIQLEKNEKIVQARQEEYAKIVEQENEAWDKQLEKLENDEKALKKLVKNLPVIGVGDSVMLGAVNDLNKTFSKGFFNAKVSRTDYEANAVLKDFNQRNMLGNPIIIGLGTNGQCGQRCRTEIMNTIGNRLLFWINVTNDYEVHVNNDIENFAKKHKNVYIIDWKSASKGHPEYFVADKIHLTPTGTKAYAKVIYNAIYNLYKKEYDKKKEKIINEHQNILKQKYTFYGNELLLNIYNDIKDNYKNADFIIDKNFDYNKLLAKIKENKSNYNIVFVFDSTIKLSNEQYLNIINLCKNKKIYIININNNNLNIDLPNVTILNFGKDIKNNKDYIMADRIHLSSSGNEALKNIIISNIKITD